MNPEGLGVGAWVPNQHVGRLCQLVHWPTIPTLALSPVIVWAYVRLARREQREMVERFGEQYQTYQQRVPMFWPRAGEWRRLFGQPAERRV